MQNALTHAIAEYDPIEAVIADLTARHKGVLFDVTQPSGMKAAKAAAKDIAQYRIALEKKRVDLKADVLERGRLIDGEAKRISAQLAALEDPIVEQIKAEERREQKVREAAILAEQERLAAEERARKEAEAAELARARAEIARQQAVLDAERKAREDEDRSRRAKIEEEERAARQRIAKAEASAKAERQVEEDRLRAEREKVEAVRRELEQKARDEQFRKDEEARAARLQEQLKREAEENARAQAERERRRKEADLLDSRRMLETFCERFAHLHPELVETIRTYLAESIKVAA